MRKLYNGGGKKHVKKGSQTKKKVPQPYAKKSSHPLAKIAHNLFPGPKGKEARQEIYKTGKLPATVLQRPVKNSPARAAYNAMKEEANRRFPGDSPHAKYNRQQYYIQTIKALKSQKEGLAASAAANDADADMAAASAAPASAASAEIGGLEDMGALLNALLESEDKNVDELTALLEKL
jgi:hypothetical protein